MPIKTYKKIKTIVLYFVIKKSCNKLPKRTWTWNSILKLYNPEIHFSGFELIQSILHNFLVSINLKML